MSRDEPPSGGDPTDRRRSGGRQLRQPARYQVREGARPGDRRIHISRIPDHLVRQDDRNYLRVPANVSSNSRLRNWLLEGKSPDAPQAALREGHAGYRWWKVMCLTGVDYFSTLGYQPGIAALAAGYLSPFATLLLVALTLGAALPIYSRVAERSPHGDGSIAILERLLTWWKGKFFVLCLLGFVATDFIITITLSTADATAHVLENPFTPSWLHGQNILVTLVFVMLLCAVFLRGFGEAIDIAVVLVVTYLTLNLIVISVALANLAANPELLTRWSDNLFADHGNVLVMVGVSLIVFPKLALGLSGFETGVAVMPLVRGHANDTEENPVRRIHDTRKLLRTAALIMSVYLIASSFLTTLLIPQAEFEEGGSANGRALAYLAHDLLGDTFGTAYDASTILILWFAGASAMAGLLNVVPRYLPRYGMAPDWTRATRPLVIVFTSIAVVVTIWFRADVEAQGGAYATGVLVLMSSAAVAVTLAMRREHRRYATALFAAISVVFFYTTAVNIVERPDGIRIASFFIVAIVVSSLISRVFRSTELRVSEVVIDDEAERMLEHAASSGTLRIIANHPDERSPREYQVKLGEQRHDHHIPPGSPVLFLEVSVADASEFASVLTVRGEQIGDYAVLQARSSSVPNAISAFALYARDRVGVVPHIYFGWGEGNPLKYLARFILFGEGDIAPVTHEILRRAERDRSRRPAIHVG